MEWAHFTETLFCPVDDRFEYFLRSPQVVYPYYVSEIQDWAWYFNQVLSGAACK